MESSTAPVHRENALAKGPVRVVTSCDEGYLPYVAVLAASLAASRAPSTEVELTILQPGIEPEARRRLAEAAPGVPLSWIDVDDAAFHRAGVVPEPLIRQPHYFRCLVGSLFPADVRRCIYLDGDTLVRGDLYDLWMTDLEGAPIGAALDYFLPRTGDAISPWRELSLDPDALYFNSGVMVIDLGAWRAAEVGKRVLGICIDHRAHLFAQGKWPQHDQFGLNAVFHGVWKRISQEWNYLSEMPPCEPRVVHYCGGGKPNSPTCQEAFSEWFYEMLGTTPWRSWRPPVRASQKL
ncbi:MAG TPA: glycosyltransferase [Actinospica sp.]|jgi:lipopolysaccharide biosynthesis glycosyltransferase|nr:glycosyltransferase [Actinospica sp.]